MLLGLNQLKKTKDEFLTELADLANALSLAIQMTGLRDAEYQSDGPDELSEIISSLRSHNWYIQNPAITKLASISEKEFPATSWFVLGRNIYQAACGNAQKAMDFIANLDNSLRRFPEPVSKYILAGILYEIYFDSQGALRQTAKAGSIVKPLSLVAKEGYEDVRAFIRLKLDEANANLFFYPGDDQKRMIIVQSEPEEGAGDESDKKRVLTSVTLQGREILVDVVPENHDWYSRYRAAYRTKDLLDDISTSLTTPLWALEMTVDPLVGVNARFAVPAGRVLDPTAVLTPVEE